MRSNQPEEECPDPCTWMADSSWADDIAAHALGSHEYLALVKILRTLITAPEPREVFDAVMAQAADLLLAGASSLWLLDPVNERLHVESATGEKGGSVKFFQLPMGQGIVGKVVAEGRQYCTDDARKDKGHAQAIADILDFQAVTLVCVPILWKGRPIGALEFMNRKDGTPFTQRELFIMNVLADFVGARLGGTPASPEEEQAPRDLP